MNYFGLHTKQEAKELRDIKASMPLDQYVILERIATSIADCQRFSSEVFDTVINQVVHDNVAKYFKNTMQYDVTEDKTGQALNMTLLIKISWL